MTVSDLIVEELAYSVAKKGAEEFLRPKNALERLFMVSAVVYLFFAIFPLKEFRLFFFAIMILTALISWIQVYFGEKQVKSLFSTSLKLILIVFIVLSFFKNTDYESTVVIAGFTYVEVEKYLAGGLFIVGTFTTALKLELLDSKSLDSYNLFLIQIINGIWRGGVVLFILVAFGWIPRQMNTFVIDHELIFTIAIILSLVGAIIPRKQVSMLSRESLSLDTILMGQTNSYSRLRDTLIINLGIIILFTILGIMTDSTNLNQIAPLLFIAIVVIIVMEPSDKRKARGRVSESLQGYSGRLNKQALNKINEMKSRFDNIDYKKPEDVFILPKTDSILKKETIDFRPEEGSVIIPVDESENGTAVVVVGKGNIEVEDASGNKKIKEFEGSTTMLLSPEEWLDLKEKKLTKSKISDIDVKNLPVKVESIDQLTNNVSNAIDRLKSWKGPSLLEEELSKLTKPSNYGVVETKDSTIVNFPGFKLFESKGLTLVQMPFFQLFESKKGTLVNMPFLKVIERDNYTYVSMPGFQILDTKDGGEIVKFLGMRFGSGSTKQLEDVIRKIPQDTRQLETHFANRLSNIITDEGTDFLLAESTDGEIFQITAGDSDSIIEEIGPNGVVKPDITDYSTVEPSPEKKEK
ncbi:MAG: hypothetical protein ACTSRU_08915, partial [Candidatus Hodarchaeales archaeon]